MTVSQQGSYSTAAAAQQLLYGQQGTGQPLFTGQQPSSMSCIMVAAVAAAFAAAQASACLEGNVIMARRMDSTKLVAELVAEMVAELVRAPGWAWSGMGI